MEVPLHAVKRIFLVCDLALLLVPVTHACNNSQTLLEENDVAFEYKIPQIDTDLPTVTETATFAMG